MQCSHRTGQDQYVQKSTVNQHALIYGIQGTLSPRKDTQEKIRGKCTGALLHQCRDLLAPFRAFAPSIIFRCSKRCLYSALYLAFRNILNIDFYFCIAACRAREKIECPLQTASQTSISTGPDIEKNSKRYYGVLSQTNMQLFFSETKNDRALGRVVGERLACSPLNTDPLAILCPAIVYVDRLIE